MTIIDILDEINSTSSKTDKIDIIRENADNENFVEVLKATYNKIEINYYMKKLPVLEKSGDMSLDEDSGMRELKKMLDKFSTRMITGNAALDYYETVVSEFNECDQEIIENILARDLKCGFSESSINKAIPGTIPVFDVVLAKPYDKHAKKVWDGSKWFASRKLDGVRVIAIKTENTFKFFSRNGKEYLTLDALIPELLEIAGKDDVVFDGEVCLMENGKEDFSGIMKQIKKKNHTIPNPRYNVFDCLTNEEFYNQESERILSDRLGELVERIPIVLASNKPPMVTYLEQYPLTEEQFAILQKKADECGWEGLILRKDVGYKGKRTDELLKVKKFYDDEYKVKEIITGDFTYTIQGEGQNTEEMMTAVVIEHKGYEVRVGSGWSLDERREFFANPKKIIGKEITCQYFEETTNKQGTVSLRFPTVKAIHGRKRDT